MAEIIKNHQQKTIDFFQSRGWQVVMSSKDEISPISVEKGGPIRCADPRYYVKENHPHTPATFGATEGIVALSKGDSISKRFSLAVKKIERSGYKPGSHGDEHQGEIYGCRFKSAWINGELHHLPVLSEEEVRIMRHTHKIHHTTLKGGHTAQGLLMNFEPDSTVMPDGRFLVKDPWYLLSLGFSMEEVLQQSSHVSELILPQEKRKLLIF